MYKVIATVVAVFLSLPLFAETPPQERFYWVAGQTDLPTINLARVVNAAEGTTWLYDAKCTTEQIDLLKDNNAGGNQKPTPTPQELFNCTSSANGSELTLTLTPYVVGKGRITVTAVSTQTVDQVQKIVETKNFYYSVEVITPSTADPKECKNWDCYLYTAFYMGYEGTSVSQVNEKGNLRLQYTGYSQVMRHLHIYGDLLQTSLQEQAATQETCTETTTESCEVDATIAANLGIYVPFNLGSGLKVGPMLDYNLQKLDSDDRFAKSYYGGVRFAYSKIRFFSIGYGKSEGIPGERVEFTGQLPVYDEKLIAGMVLNVSVDGTAEEQGVSSGDSINVYLMTRVDFTKIFTNFTQ